MRAEKRSIRRRLLVQTMIMLLALTLALGSISFTLSYNNIKRQALADFTAASRNAATVFENVIANFDNVSSSMTQMSFVRNMMTSFYEYDQFTYRAFTGDIRSLAISNTYMDYLGIYFPAREYVVSSVGTYNQTVNRSIFLPVDTGEEAWLAYIANLGGEHQLQYTRVSIGQQEAEGILYGRGLRLLPSEENARAAFICFWKRKSIEQLLSTAINLYENDVWVLHHGQELFATQEGGAPMIATVGEAQGGAQELESVFTQGSWVIYRAEAPRNALTFVIRKQQAAVFQSLKVSVYTNLAILAAFVLAGMLISYRFSEAQYRPLRTLMRAVGSYANGNEFQTQNEYNLIRHIVESLGSSYQRQTDALAQQTLLLQEGRFLTFLKDTGAADAQSLLTFRNRLRGPRFNCIVVRDAHALETADGGLLASMRRAMESLGIGYHYLRDDYDSIFALSYRSPEDIQEFATYLDFLYPHHEAWCAGIGSEQTKFDSLPAAYREALAATHYRKYVADSLLTFYEDIVEDDYYFFTPEHQKRLVNFVRAGNTAQAIQLFDELYQINTHERNISRGALQYFFRDIAFTLFKISREAGLDTRVIYTEHLKVASNDIIDKIHETIRLICEAIENKESKSGKKSMDIVAFVDEHLTDPNLSLQMLAEALEITPPYASSLFKERAKENFNEYVNRKRVDIAKTLLANGGEDYAAIMNRVGFSNDVTFRRVFKKLTGITPSSFRAQYRP